MPLLRSPAAAPSRRRLRAASLALALPALTLAGCADDAPTAPARTSANIEVAPPVLTWVAPLGTGTADPATLDSTAAPVVEVCAWTGAACAGAPVARFATAPGGSDLPLTVNAAAGVYEGMWALTDPRFTTRRTYRVRVLQAGTELGALSVDVVRGRWALARADGTLAPLQAATAIPIRFHLARATAQEQLPGAPDGPVGPSIPDREFVPRAADYSTTHPDLPGMPISFNVLWLTFRPGVTVGQANALLGQIGAEIAGGIRGTPDLSGVLFLRVPTTTHAQMIALLATLRADPRVSRAVQDILLGPDVAPRPSAIVPRDEQAAWTWTVVPGGANWGMESVRAPQLWALNGAVCKVLRHTAPATDCSNLDPDSLGADVPMTGVLDLGFDPNHSDLKYLDQTPKKFGHPHGTHVAGIIGALFDNREPTSPPDDQKSIGVDGLNPFARLVVRAVDLTGSETDAFRGVSAAAITWQYDAMLSATPDIRVTNTSLGYNWHSAKPTPINPDTSKAAKTFASIQGAVFAAVQLIHASVGRRVPALFASAGNDGGRNAQWNSPMTNARIEHNLASVTIVEADSLVAGGSGQITRSTFSNIRGDISAPGSRIGSTWIFDQYILESGTSQAAPHAAGLAGYLVTLARLYGPSAPDRLAPTLSPGTTLFGDNPLRALLQQTSTNVGNVAHRIDAFAAALQLDIVFGGDLILRGLVDTDDGTPDGNTRLNADRSPNTEEDADGDGGVGDGRVDMRDFRRWRDWLLATEANAGRVQGLSLDGSDRHPKKDVNGNHRWAVRGDGDDENVYPRGDFNGDGVLSRTAKRKVWGVMAKKDAQQEVTDLEVLQELFDDPNYKKEQLPDLIESADLAVDAGACFRGTGAARVRVRVWPRDGAPPGPGSPGRVFDAAAPVQVFTSALHAAGYAAQVEALAPDGTVLARTGAEFPEMPLGSDTRWAPACVADATEYWTGTWITYHPVNGAIEVDSGVVRLALGIGQGQNPQITGSQYVGNDRGGFYTRIPIDGISVTVLENGTRRVGIIWWEYDGADGRRHKITLLPQTDGTASGGQVAEGPGGTGSLVWFLALTRTGAFPPPVISGVAPRGGPSPPASRLAPVRSVTQQAAKFRTPAPGGVNGAESRRTTSATGAARWSAKRPTTAYARSPAAPGLTTTSNVERRVSPGPNAMRLPPVIAAPPSPAP